MFRSILPTEIVECLLKQVRVSSKFLSPAAILQTIVHIYSHISKKISDETYQT